jgi:hypothetical protein
VPLLSLRRNHWPLWSCRYESHNDRVPTGRLFVWRILQAGRCVLQGKAFSEPWMKQSLPAILEAWQSGQAQGLAVAETLFGRNNPAGRTAVSFAASADVLPVFYNHKKTAKRGGYQNPPVIEGGGYAPSSDSGSSVLWAFGHGLSFGASFVYSDLTLSASTVPMSGKLEVDSLSSPLCSCIFVLGFLGSFKPRVK